MRGTHRGVWSSKGQRLIEAELFAAESKRSAQNGRALLCAANHASEIQGSSAAYTLKDARNRAPVIPRFAAHLRCVSAKEGKGSQEGISTHLIRARRGKEDSGLRPKPYGVLSPFAPVGGHRHPRAAEGGQKTLSMGHILAFCIRDAGTGENVNLCLRIEKMCFCIEENYPSDKTKSID